MKRAKTRKNGAIRRPYVSRAREFDALIERLELDEDACMELFDIPGRTSRRYRRGDGKAPLATLKLLRLMARGTLSKRQVARA